MRLNILNVQYTVEIWQNTGATLTAEEIRSDSVSFNVTYPNVSKFETIRGSGCDISLLSSTSMKFINLYTSDIQEYYIKLYQGTSLLWIGFLNSNLYSEPLSEYDNYPVSLTGNDGLALLEKINYLQSDFSNYSGFTSNWTIIKNILAKLNIAWNGIYIGLSTTSSEITINETLLESTYSLNDNYYDEDDKPMNCREVLKTILEPLSAYIQIINSNVYITDNNLIAANSTYTFTKYNGTSFAYSGTTSINLNIGDLSTIKFATNSSTLNILPIVNRQKVVFSPYQTSTLINYIPDDEIFTGDTVTRYWGVNPHTWTEKAYNGSDYWTTLNGLLSIGSSYFSELIGTGDNADEAYKFLKVGPTNFPSASGSSPDCFTYKYKIPAVVTTKESTTIYSYVGEWTGNTMSETIYWYNINDVVTYGGNYYLCTNAHYPAYSTPPPNANFSLTSASILDPIEAELYYIKIEMQCYVRILDSLGSAPPLFSKIPTSCVLTTKLGIGNKKFSNAYGWEDAADDVYLKLTFASLTDGNWDLNAEKWLPIYPNEYYLIPLFGFTGNTIDFRISRYDCYSSIYGDVTDEVKDVRLKDIKFTIVNKYYQEIESTDTEYNTYVTKNIKYDGEDITCKLGTNTIEFPHTKGAILGCTNGFYYFIKSFTRNSKTDILENLLAGSIVSNYMPRTLELQCTTNLFSSLFGTLTYTNFLSGKKFVIQCAIIDYIEATIELNIQETIIDNYDIIKNY